MPAAAKRKQTAKVSPALVLHTEPFTEETPDTHGEVVVWTDSPLATRLEVGIEARERSILRGEPIEGAVYMPNFEKLDPTTQDQLVPVHLDQLENIGRAFLQLAAEAKRLGILPAASPTAAKEA